jgi:hypothetical protein
MNDVGTVAAQSRVWIERDSERFPLNHSISRRGFATAHREKALPSDNRAPIFERLNRRHSLQSILESPR